MRSLLLLGMITALALAGCRKEKSPAQPEVSLAPSDDAIVSEGETQTCLVKPEDQEKATGRGKGLEKKKEKEANDDEQEDDDGDESKEEQGCSDSAPAQSDSEQLALSYARDIAPMMAASCATSNCHAGSAPSDGIALDSKEAVMAGIDASITSIEDGSMPIGNVPSISAAQLQLLRDWKASNFPD